MRERESLALRLSALATASGCAFAMSAALQARVRELCRGARPLVLVPRRTPPLTPIEVALLELEAGKILTEKVEGDEEGPPLRGPESEPGRGRTSSLTPQERAVERSAFEAMLDRAARAAEDDEEEPAAATRAAMRRRQF